MKKKKILIADDEPRMRELVVLRLEANGYETMAVSDGSEVLDKAEGFKPDLIILDIRMAKVDGYSALTKLKQSEEVKDTPVIILTAYVEMRDLFEAEGVKDYILKPFDDQDFLLRVARAMKK